MVDITDGRTDQLADCARTTDQIDRGQIRRAKHWTNQELSRDDCHHSYNQLCIDHRAYSPTDWTRSEKAFTPLGH